MQLDFNEVGSTGLKRFGGYVYEEFLHELSGTRAIKVYREMSENDAMIGSMLFAIKMLIRQVDWPIEKFSEDPEDVMHADFLRSCFDDMEQSWNDTVSEILSMLVYGWSWHETVYKIRGVDSSKFSDFKIGWKKLPIRAQESFYQWIFAQNGDVQALQQMAAPDYTIRTLPWEKSLLFRTESTKGNPEGKSILRNAYRSWILKKHMENIEAIGVERDLAGLPIAWVPADLLEPDAPPERKSLLAQVKKIVTNIKRDEQEGLVFPLIYDDNGNKMFDLTLLTAQSRRQFDTTAIITRYDQRIAMTVLADFILLGHTQVGTFSLSSSKTELFATAIGAWLDAICDVMNRFAIPRLFKINGYNLDKLPRLSHGDIESTDLTELANFVTALTGAGADVFPDKDLQDYLYRQAGMPISADSTAKL